jgi:hypothetical protein
MTGAPESGHRAQSTCKRIDLPQTELGFEAKIELRHIGGNRAFDPEQGFDLGSGN